MEAHPPSYSHATTTLLRDPLPIIAPYLTRRTLLAACRVSRAWHRVFATRLWGDPCRAFSGEVIRKPSNDDEETPGFDSHAFAKCVKRTRLSTRTLTYTLRLSPLLEVQNGSINDNVTGGVRSPTGKASAADRDLYPTTSVGINPTWLRNLIEMLPNLRCLDASRSIEVDHEVLMSFGVAKPPERGLETPGRQLKLLDVSYLTYATPAGLTALFKTCENVVYLDVSGTSSVKDTSALAAISRIRSLRALSMRMLGLLNSEKISLLVKVIGRRVRFLDLTGSPIDEESVRLLLSECIGSGEVTNADEGNTGKAGQMPPAYNEDEELSNSQCRLQRRRTAKLNSSSQETAQNFGEGIRQSLLSGRADRLAIEDEPDMGITHLRLDILGDLSNHVARRLILHKGLIFLDINLFKSPSLSLHSTQPSGQESESRSRLGGKSLRKLTLEHLRIPYQLFFSIFGTSELRQLFRKPSPPSPRHTSNEGQSPTDQQMSNLTHSLTFSLSELHSLTLTNIPTQSPVLYIAQNPSPGLALQHTKESTVPSELVILLIKSLSLCTTASSSSSFSLTSTSTSASSSSWPQPQRLGPPESSTLRSLTLEILPAAVSANHSTAPLTRPAQSPHSPNLTGNSASISNPTPKKTNPKRKESKGWNYAATTKSITGDRDSEALWSYAEGVSSPTSTSFSSSTSASAFKSTSAASGSYNAGGDRSKGKGRSESKEERDFSFFASSSSSTSSSSEEADSDAEAEAESYEGDGINRRNEKVMDVVAPVVAFRKSARVAYFEGVQGVQGVQGVSGKGKGKELVGGGGGQGGGEGHGYWSGGVRVVRL